MVDSTNPKIMSENIRALSNSSGGGGGESVLPSVTPSDAGKALIVSDLGSWIAGNVSQNIEISETAVDTGFRLFGKRIMARLYPYGGSFRDSNVWLIVYALVIRKDHVSRDDASSAWKSYFMPNLQGDVSLAYNENIAEAQYQLIFYVERGETNET